MIDYREFQHLLVGRWEEVLKTYGIDIPKMRGKNSINYPCPCCGGDDRAHWRESDGRLALFCRNCAVDSMKSPEQVIQEVCGIGFNELVQDLSCIAGDRAPEDIKKAQINVNAQPKINLPANHRQDHEKSIAFLGDCSYINAHKIFNKYGVQPPYRIPVMNDYPCFPCYNHKGVPVNIAVIGYENNHMCKENLVSFSFGVHEMWIKSRAKRKKRANTNLTESESSALAHEDAKKLSIKETAKLSGMPFGCFHIVPQCNERSTGKVKYCSSIIDAYHHWYEFGDEIRVTFSSDNTKFMLNVGIINIDSVIYVDDFEKEYFISCD